MARGLNLDFTPVPDVTPQTNASPGFRIQVDPAAFGAPQAKALETLGRGVETAADTAMEVAQQRQKLVNDIHSSDVSSWYANQTTDLWNKFNQLRGRNANDELEGFKQNLESLRQTALSQAGSLQEKAALVNNLRYVQEQYYKYATNHADSELRTWATRSAKDATESTTAMAAMSFTQGDEAGFQRHLRAQELDTANYWRSQGYDQDSINAEVLRTRSATLKLAIETKAANGDIPGASQALDKYKGKMDAQSVLAVSQRLKGDQERLEGRSLADEVLGRTPAGRRDVIPIVNNAWKSQGASPNAIAGVMYNIQQESGFDPTLRHPDQPNWGGEAHYAHGLYQEGAEEWNHYEKWLNQNHPGANWRDPQLQSDFAAWNLKTNYPGTWARMNAAATPEDAAAIYAKEYLKPSEANLQSRLYKIYRGDLSKVPASAIAPSRLDREDVFNELVARTQGRPLGVQNAALSWFREVMANEREERTQSAALFDRQVKDTMTEAAATGDVKQPLVESDFVSNRKRGESIGDAQEAYQSYISDIRNAQTYNAFREMTPEEMNAAVVAAEPRSDSPGGMYRAAQRQKFLSDSMDKILKQRRDDPAGAVDRSPTVQVAKSQYDPNKPETFQSVVEARLAAQRELGIEAEYQQPITKNEALQLASPLWRALPGKERQTVVDIAQRAQAMYGDQAAQALSYAINVHSGDAQAKETATGIVNKMVKGIPLTRTEGRQLDQMEELNASNKALRTGVPVTIDISPNPIPPQETQAPKQAAPPPPAAAFMALREHPDTAEEFDRKYGKGKAEQFLKNYR